MQVLPQEFVLLTLDREASRKNTNSASASLWL